MRLVQFLSDSGERCYGQDLGDRAAQIIETVPSGTCLLSAKSIVATGKICQFDNAIAPIEPKNVFCIGLNYAEHAKEGGKAPPKRPVLFMKPTTAVAGPGAEIRLPAVCEYEVDYECELAVIIGQGGRDIAEADALDHVFGYTVANDVSARKWQKELGGGQFIRGKSFDTFCPLGPVIVTARPMNDGDQDFISDPQDLRLTTVLSGKQMQNGHTGDMIFTVAQLISFISRDTTLLPGTLLLTGTPPGVGFAQKPPRFLEAGDEVTVGIDGIGEMTNRVVEA